MKFLFLLMASVFLAACSPKKDVDYFHANDEARAKTISECVDSITTPEAFLAFERNATCVAAWVAEPYHDPNYWHENTSLFAKLIPVCRMAGLEIKNSNICQSAFIASRGKPVHATLDPPKK